MKADTDLQIDCRKLENHVKVLDKRESGVGGDIPAIESA
jgi:hypothetical protein